MTKPSSQHVEVLHTCPRCGRKNFTTRGLKAHVCKGPQIVTFEVVEPSRALALPDKPDPIAEQWAKARRYVEAATLFQRASLAAQIMAGFVLLDLFKGFRETRGGDHKSSRYLVENQKFHSETFDFHPPVTVSEKRELWEEAVKRELAISKVTAWRWMEMARAAKSRLTKGDIDLAAILEKNPGAITPAEQELLKRAVHKISDARTQMEFLLECGVTKAPPAYHGGGGAHDTADDDGEPPAKSAQELCMEILEQLALARKGACDHAVWMQMSRQQHDDLKDAFDDADAQIAALHAKTHGRAARANSSTSPRVARQSQ